MEDQRGSAVARLQKLDVDDVWEPKQGRPLDVDELEAKASVSSCTGFAQKSPLKAGASASVCSKGSKLFAGRVRRGRDSLVCR